MIPCLFLFVYSFFVKCSKNTKIKFLLFFCLNFARAIFKLWLIFEKKLFILVIQLFKKYHLTWFMIIIKILLYGVIVIRKEGINLNKLELNNTIFENIKHIDKMVMNIGVQENLKKY